MLNKLSYGKMKMTCRSDEQIRVLYVKKISQCTLGKTYIVLVCDFAFTLRETSELERGK
jgi:hypothetical protein